MPQPHSVLAARHLGTPPPQEARTGGALQDLPARARVATRAAAAYVLVDLGAIPSGRDGRVPLAASVSPTLTAQCIHGGALNDADPPPAR